jgi:predicted ATPase/DNA-binding XRE family transcriptional regulator
MNSISAITPQSFTSFGELLRYLRERVELSQKELAAQVGYHYSYMSRIEKNQRTPDPKTLLARFIPALVLDDEPQWTARLLELAGASEANLPSTVSTADIRPTSFSPTTALPIFDLSASNLPVFLTPLLGRNAEVSALTELLNRSDVRLVTVVGPPGVGKTRLAAHLAAQMAGMFAQGPLFVDMTTITQEADFLPAMAEALDVIETSDGSLTKNIIAYLRQRQMMLVIDNLEHVIHAASYFPSLLMGAPNIKILATSREALHVSGEFEFPITPLALPETVSEMHPLTNMDDEYFESLSHFAAVQLFTQRARAVQPTFKLTSENISAIVAICQQLDGLPLAIELATARIKTLTPQAMLQQLNRRLEWLTRGSRDSLKQTLRDTIEWSYTLLSEPERIVLRRLSAFADGCTLRAAEVICAGSPQDATEAVVRRAEVLDLIVKLIDKSLVVTETNAQQIRYHLLETVREFSREKLSQAGELDETLTRHLIHFTEYAEEAETHLDGTDQAKWIRITEKEHRNFLFAMDYALTNPEVSSYGFRIGAAISLFWLERSHFQEGSERLRILLEKATALEHRKARAKMLYRLGAIQACVFNYNAAYKLYEQSIEISRALDDKQSLASALFYFGEICTTIKDYHKARTLLDECTAICWETHFTTQLAMALTDLGKVSWEQGESEQALKTAKEALAIAERINDTWGLSHALRFLGSLHRQLGERDIAIDYFERSLKYIREIGDRFAEGETLANLAILYNLKEDYPTAGRAAEQSFVAFQSIGDELQQPFPLRMMGYSAIHAGNIVRARALILESLKGNRGLDHLPGQLACLVAVGTCELAQDNVEKAATYASIVENRISAESIYLLEPDTVALNKLLITAKNKLGNKSFKQIIEKSKSLRAEDMIASEFPSAV